MKAADRPQQERARCCQTCGIPLPPDAPDGNCPVCLMRLAVAGTLSKTGAAVTSEPSDASRSTLHASGATPSTFAKTPFVARTLGDYELLEEIARGGMGIVYRARQKSLNRIVAVKLLLFGELSSEAFIQRFRVEAQAAASLKHPNIVSIYEIGQEVGQHYFSMEYVEGQNLAQLVRDKPLSPKKAAAYVKTIAEAIQSAHEKGIVHRDLKPSNVLIDTEDRVRVTDFGLAKRLVGTRSTASLTKPGEVRDGVESVLTELTVTGQVLGTPNYLSPEQALARKEVSSATDVYALGGILYYLLTARPPFQAETLAQTLQQVVNAEPVSPRLLNASVPVDLETICLKCLEKEPGRRYSSAAELVAELGRFLRDEPIQARPVSRSEKTWRWFWRNPALSGTLSAALALLLVVSIGSPIALYRINQAWKTAESEKLAARQGEYASDMLLAQQALDANNRGRAVTLLEKHRPAPKSEARYSKSEIDLRNWEWRYLWQQCQSDELAMLGHHSSAVERLFFAASGGLLVSQSSDGVKVWDVRTRKEYGSLPKGFIIRPQALSADGKTLAGVQARSLLSPGTLAFWEVITQREIAPLVPCNSTSIVDVAFSPTGRTLAIAKSDEKTITVELWDLGSKSRVKTLEPIPADRGYLLFSPRGDTLARLSSFGYTVLLWDLAAETSKVIATGHTKWLRNMAFSPDGRWLGTASFDRTAKIWDLASGREMIRLTNHNSLVFSVAFSPNGKLLATASADQTIKLWDTSNWQELRTLKGHRHEVWAVAFSPDEQTLASAAKDGEVKLWSLEPKTREQDRLALSTNLYELARGWSKRVAFSLDGQTFLTVSSNGVATVWTSATLSVKESFQTSVSSVTSGAVSSKEPLVAIGREDGRVTLWKTSGQELVTLEAHSKAVTVLAFSLDGSRLATTSLDQTTGIWDTTNPTNVWRITTCRHADQLSPGSLRFSEDGRILAVGFPWTAILWDPATGQRLRTFTGHKDLTTGLAFSPDGQTLATANWDGTAKLWDLVLRRQTVTLWSHLLAVNTVAFSPDGTRLATGENTVKLWDVARGQEVATLNGHSDTVGNAAFLDEDTLISASNNEVILWRAASFSEIAALERIRQTEHREPNNGLRR